MVGGALWNRPVGAAGIAIAFCGRPESAGLPPPVDGQFPLCFWHMPGTGDYGVDIEIGDNLGALYLGCLDQRFRDDGGPLSPPLQWIVADMPRKLTGVEIGFLRRICIAAVDAAGNRLVAIPVL